MWWSCRSEDRRIKGEEEEGGAASFIFINLMERQDSSSCRHNKNLLQKILAKTEVGST